MENHPRYIECGLGAERRGLYFSPTSPVGELVDTVNNTSCRSSSQSGCGWRMTLSLRRDPTGPRCLGLALQHSVAVLGAIHDRGRPLVPQPPLIIARQLADSLADVAPRAGGASSLRCQRPHSPRTDFYIGRRMADGTDAGPIRFRLDVDREDWVVLILQIRMTGIIQ
jgi:hypothetical protein